MNLLFVVSLLVASPTADAAAKPVSADDVRGAVARSVPFLESRGQAWIDERQCVSCHQVPFMVWGLQEARRSGAAVDRQKLSETRAWAVDWRNWSAPANREKTDEPQAVAGNVDTMYQLLLGRPYGSDVGTPEWASRFARDLLAAQQAEGSWKACGQLPLQNRPARETTEVTTMWALLALAPLASSQDDWPQKLSSTRKWLDQGGADESRESTEWWAVRLLWERRFGASEKAAEMRKQLLARQHDDGGWGWLADSPSDALGTGIALYALSQDKDDAAAAIRRAQRFLLDTQQKDGSWTVPSTLKRATGGVKATSTYWGTAWAVIGLVRTMP